MDTKEQKINKINEILGERLASIIGILGYNDTEKDKLIYRACLNEEEKINYTKSELKKCQDEILQCDASLAPYVASIIDDFHLPDIDIRLPTMCINYIRYELENLAELFVDDYESVEAIENDDFLNNDFEFEGEDFAYEQTFIFVKHFFYMGYRIFSLKALIEDVEQTKNENTKEDQETPINNPMIIAVRDFEKFKTDLEYNYPFEHAPMVYFQKWKTNLSYFKKEVLNNITSLNVDARKPYINSLLFDLEEMLDACQVTKEELDELYKQHNTNEYDILKNRDYENALHIAIHAEPSKFDNYFEDGFDKMSGTFQFTFYNYHYGETIRNAINFLNEQKIEYTSSSTKYEKKVNEPKESNNKVKSFEYINLQTESENITNLLKELKILNLVAQGTELKHFRSVFTNKEVIQKITWTGNISELAFFIKTIHNTAKKVKDTKQKLWEITVSCFQMDNGNILEQSKLRGQKKPATSNEIEKVINDYL